jgi:hypothetical protein
MPCVGFEPTIPASERAKAVHPLDRWATMTSNLIIITPRIGVLHRGPLEQYLDVLERCSNDFDYILLVYGDHFPK